MLNPLSGIDRAADRPTIGQTDRQYIFHLCPLGSNPRAKM